MRATLPHPFLSLFGNASKSIRLLARVTLKPSPPLPSLMPSCTITHLSPVRPIDLFSGIPFLALASRIRNGRLWWDNMYV